MGGQKLKIHKKSSICTWFLRPFPCVSSDVVRTNTPFSEQRPNNVRRTSEQSV